MWVALFAASGYLSLLVFAPIWGFLADIYGRRLMMLRANFFSAMLIPLMAFVPTVLWLVILRFMLGACAGTVTASQVLVSSNTPVGNRVFALGTLSSAVYGGTMAGTFLGGMVVDRFGYRNAFFICTLLLLASGFLVFFGVRERFRKTTCFSRRVAEVRVRLPDFGAVWLILALVAVVGFAIRFDRPFMPLLVESVTGPEQAATWTGVIASLSAVAGIVAGSLLGWMADRYSAPRVAMWSALVAGILMVPQGFAGNLGVLMAARLGMMFFAGGLDPVFQIWLAKATPDDQRGVLMGWATSAKSLGWVLCFLAGGGVAMAFGVRWVFIFAAPVFLVLIPIIKAATVKLKDVGC